MALSQEFRAAMQDHPPDRHPPGSPYPMTAAGPAPSTHDTHTLHYPGTRPNPTGRIGIWPLEFGRGTCGKQQKEEAGTGTRTAVGRRDSSHSHPLHAWLLSSLVRRVPARYSDLPFLLPLLSQRVSGSAFREMNVSPPHPHAPGHPWFSRIRAGARQSDRPCLFITKARSLARRSSGETRPKAEPVVRLPSVVFGGGRRLKKVGEEDHRRGEHHRQTTGAVATAICLRWYLRPPREMSMCTVLW